MARERQGIADRHVLALFGVGAIGGMSDGQLLDRYAGRGGEAAELAFAALVERHGPMVLRTCRAVLRDEHAAHDAFQATFLVLVHRAGTLRARETLGPWLHQVASRVARCARSAAARRRRHEQKAAEAAPCTEAGRDWDDLPAVVHEEIGRLPENYRAAVVLCGLEGLTQEQAARQLGWPIGTLQSRLARGRERLRGRLARRGLAPSVGALGATCAGGRTASAMPAGLKGATIRAAVAIATGGTVTSGTVPAEVVRLTEGVLRSMSLTQLKWTAAVLLALGLGAAGVLARQAPEAEAKDAAAPPPHELAKVAMPDYVVEPPDMIRVEVLEALPGRPISGERLVRPDGKTSLGFYGEIHVAGLTLPEIKEKLIQHLRKYLNDEQLGLVSPDPGRPGQTRKVAPADSTKVFVDVTTYNSKNYYVQGDVAAPGKLVITGNDTVLDAINYAGGLLQSASKSNIRLVRPPGPGADRARILKVDYEAITYEGDPATNYQLLPGDRLIVPRDPKARNSQQEEEDGLAMLRALERRLEGVERRLDLDPKVRPARVKDQEAAPADPETQPAPAGRQESAIVNLQPLERRLEKVERKLDRVIELLGGAKP